MTVAADPLAKCPLCSGEGEISHQDRSSECFGCGGLGEVFPAAVAQIAWDHFDLHVEAWEEGRVGGSRPSSPSFPRPEEVS